MPPTLTNRELKNKSTGIDIIVPEYQIIPGKIVNTVLYHVIVITRLFYFKTRQHKESDLVQFAVAKKYEEVEDLQTKLVSKFPSVHFDPLPRMSLIVTEKVLNERKKFLEKLLGHIAKTPKLCSCLPVLEFLEANKISIKQNQLKNPEQEKSKEETTEDIPDEVERDIFGVTQMDSDDDESDGDSKEDEEDAFVVDMKRPEGRKTSTEKPTGTSDEFLKSSGTFSFGTGVTDETIMIVNDLFIPKEALVQDNSMLFVSEDDPELFKIDDDLDKLLNISKKSDEKKSPSAVKPRAPPRPDLKPRPTPKPRFVETSSSTDTHFLSKPGVPPKPKPRARAKAGSASKTEVKQTKEPSTASRSKDREGSLDDIFGKPSRKDLFSEICDDDDDDLFKQEPTEGLGVDDITKYIEKNTGQTTFDKVDLFS